MDMIAVEAFMSLTSFKVNDYLCNMNFLEWRFSFNFFFALAKPLWQIQRKYWRKNLTSMVHCITRKKKEESNKNSNDFRSQIICK